MVPIPDRDAPPVSSPMSGISDSCDRNVKSAVPSRVLIALTPVCAEFAAASAAAVSGTTLANWEPIVSRDPSSRLIFAAWSAIIAGPACAGGFGNRCPMTAAFRLVDDRCRGAGHRQAAQLHLGCFGL